MPSSATSFHSNASVLNMLYSPIRSVWQIISTSSSRLDQSCIINKRRIVYEMGVIPSHSITFVLFAGNDPASSAALSAAASARLSDTRQCLHRADGVQSSGRTQTLSASVCVYWSFFWSVAQKLSFDLKGLFAIRYFLPSETEADTNWSNVYSSVWTIQPARAESYTHYLY